MTFRPKKLDEIVGQASTVERLSISLNSARKRGVSFPHLLLSGPPGLGKTTLANVIGNEMGSNCLVANGGNIRQPKDMMPFLMKIQERDVLFIDEVHRIPIKVEEFLYPVMEDFKLMLISKGEIVAETDLPKFTMVGATTLAGNLSRPFIDRFKLHERLKLYSPDELASLLKGNADRLSIKLEYSAIRYLAKVSRGTPRIANKNLEWVRDCLVNDGKMNANDEYVARSLDMKGIDEDGLTEQDRKYLRVLKSFDRPVGVNTLSAACYIDNDTIENIIEPYLLRLGRIAKTNRGRVAV